MNYSRSVLRIAAATAVTSALWIGSASATTTTLLLGDQDFTSGTLVGGIADFLVPQTGEPSPFGVYSGGDTPLQATPGPFIASWTFAYTPGAITAATVAFGIWDHDTAAPGNQLTSFTVDGVDVTAALNALMEAPGIGTGAQYDIFTLALTGQALAELADGAATFAMRLDGPALCGAVGGTTVCDPNVGNGAALDFSRLTLTTDGTPVPEPATLALVGVALAAAGLRRRRGTRHV